MEMIPKVSVHLKMSLTAAQIYRFSQERHLIGRCTQIHFLHFLFHTNECGLLVFAAIIKPPPTKDEGLFSTQNKLKTANTLIHWPTSIRERTHTDTHIIHINRNLCTTIEIDACAIPCSFLYCGWFCGWIGRGLWLENPIEKIYIWHAPQSTAHVHIEMTEGTQDNTTPKNGMHQRSVILIMMKFMLIQTIWRESTNIKEIHNQRNFSPRKKKSRC